MLLAHTQEVLKQITLATPVHKHWSAQSFDYTDVDAHRSCGGPRVLSPYEYPREAPMTFGVYLLAAITHRHMLQYPMFAGAVDGGST